MIECDLKINQWRNHDPVRHWYPIVSAVKGKGRPRRCEIRHARSVRIRVGILVDQGVPGWSSIRWHDLEELQRLQYSTTVLLILVGCQDCRSFEVPEASSINAEWLGAGDSRILPVIPRYTSHCASVVNMVQRYTTKHSVSWMIAILLNIMKQKSEDCSFFGGR